MSNSDTNSLFVRTKYIPTTWRSGFSDATAPHVNRNLWDAIARRLLITWSAATAK